MSNNKYFNAKPRPDMISILPLAGIDDTWISIEDLLLTRINKKNVLLELYLDSALELDADALWITGNKSQIDKIEKWLPSYFIKRRNLDDSPMRGEHETLLRVVTKYIDPRLKQGQALWNSIDRISRTYGGFSRYLLPDVLFIDQPGVVYDTTNLRQYREKKYKNNILFKRIKTASFVDDRSPFSYDKTYSSRLLELYNKSHQTPEERGNSDWRSFVDILKSRHNKCVIHDKTLKDLMIWESYLSFIKRDFPHRELEIDWC